MLFESMQEIDMDAPIEWEMFDSWFPQYYMEKDPVAKALEKGKKCLYNMDVVGNNDVIMMYREYEYGQPSRKQKKSKKNNF